jgi:hypothetical protein
MSISEITPRIPLSSNLGLLCLFDKGDTDGAFGPRHLVIHGWRLLGEIDFEALRGALDDVVVRHEMLRTQVVRDGDEPYQRVHPPGSPQLLVLDLPADDPRPRDERVDEFVNEIEAGSLSVQELPHLRAVIGRFDERDAVLVLIAHHTASDGWSLHVIIRDLAAFYAARQGSGDPVLPPMRQYQDYAFWQQHQLVTPAADASREYWRQTLAGAQIQDIRADHRVPPGVAGVYSVHRFLIDEQLTSTVLEFAKAMRSSPFMVLLSAFNALLHQMTGVTDLVAPMITSGRVEPSFNETVGPFFNMVPLRTDLSQARNFMGLVRLIRQTCLQAYTHELPFGEIAAQAPELTKTYERDDGAVCAFQVLQFPGMLEAEKIGDVEYTEVRRRLMSYPRTSDIPNGVLWGLDILPTGEIAGTMRFNSKQFDESTMVRMVEGFRRVLRNGISDPNSPLSAL